MLQNSFSVFIFKNTKFQFSIKLFAYVKASHKCKEVIVIENL